MLGHAGRETLMKESFQRGTSMVNKPTRWAQTKQLNKQQTRQTSWMGASTERQQQGRTVPSSQRLRPCLDGLGDGSNELPTAVVFGDVQLLSSLLAPSMAVAEIVERAARLT